MAYVVAIDEGTTSTRAILYDLEKNKIIAQKSSNIKQFYPELGYVEESASEIYAETLASLIEILESLDDISEVKGIGITNQRETVIAWDKKTGKPLYNAIVWQCRRTAEFMERINEKYGELIHRKTGLVCDAYFSASKMKWLLDNVPEIKSKNEKGELCFGTVDSFLCYKLTNGKAFVTDVTNASRTMLFNLETLTWDNELLKIFGISENSLPKIVMSDEKVGEFEYKGVKIPVCGIAGDQQAALVGQGCLSEGDSKITYGTGLFMLYNTGYKSIISQKGLVTTVGYGIGGKVSYAFEGSVFNAGSAVQWLRDNLGFFRRAGESEGLAKSVNSSEGVYVVPAFTGLGAPYWDPEARGMITGLTRSSTKAHITRATLEAIAYSAKDLVCVMEEESGGKLSELKCDGGASSNDFLMDFQANLIGVNVNRPEEKESTALGAAYLCAAGLGIIKPEDISSLRICEKLFTPSGAEKDKEKYEKLYEGWKKAVKRCLYD